MSDSNFDEYLSMLRGLLRLDTNRREDIANELRDHLEERFAALVQSGHSRDRAIAIALDEFGDAAGLAGEFLRIFRMQRRRRIMRLTAGSVAACLLVGWMVAAWWAGSSTAPVMVQAVAQETISFGESFLVQPAGEQEAPQVPGLPGGTTGSGATVNANEVTERKLATRMQAVFAAVPLHEFLTGIGERIGIEFHVNRKELEDQGVDVSAPVDLHFANVRADMLLDLALRNLNLVYTIRDGIVMVTTESDLESTFEVRVYNCFDLGALAAGHSMPGVPGTVFGSTTAAGGTAGASSQGSLSMPGAVPGPVRVAPPGGVAAPGGLPGAGPALGGMPGSAFGSVSEAGTGSSMGMAGMMGAPLHAGMGIGMMTGGEGMGRHSPDQGALIRVITSTIVPDSWQATGGSGTIEPYYGGLLVVNHNPHVHGKIQKLLEMIRAASKQNPGTVVRER